jgi:hypothetical protein
MDIVEAGVLAPRQRQDLPAEAVGHAVLDPPPSIAMGEGGRAPRLELGPHAPQLARGEPQRLGHLRRGHLAVCQ